jgi:hypothetical protein
VNRQILRLVPAFLLLAASAIALADSSPLIDCPWYPPNSGSDFANRGFYNTSWPGTTLKTVTLYMSFPAAGAYQLTLTATQGTFGGTLIQTATTGVNVSNTDFTAVTFNFGGVSVNAGSTVAFQGNVTAHPAGVNQAVQMQDVTEPDCRLTETTGFDPPLSSFRRGGVAALITGDIAPSFSHRSNVPASASIHGANNTFFHTDVFINNPLGTDLAVTATYHCFAGMNCGSGTANFAVPAGEAVTFTDAVNALFGAPESAGAIVFQYTTPNYVPNLKVVTRTYTPNQPNPTNGAVVNGEPGIAAAGNATFIGMGNNGGDNSKGFRTNAGFFNPHQYPNTVSFRLTTKDGAALGTTVTQTWNPGEARQLNDIFAQAGAGSTVTTDAVLHVSATLPGFPYATVIDNGTGDSIIEQ